MAALNLVELFCCFLRPRELLLVAMKLLHCVRSGAHLDPPPFPSQPFPLLTSNAAFSLTLSKHSRSRSRICRHHMDFLSPSFLPHMFLLLPAGNIKTRSPADSPLSPVPHPWDEELSKATHFFLSTWPRYLEVSYQILVQMGEFSAPPVPSR